MKDTADKASSRRPDQTSRLSARSRATALRAFRVYCLLAGVLVVGFWPVYRFASDVYVDPLWIRLVISFSCGALLVSSYLFERIAASLDRWVFCLFSVLGLWFVALTAMNGFTSDYAVGLLFVVSAISLALSLSPGPRIHLPLFQVGMVGALGAAILIAESETSPFILYCCVVGMTIVTGIASRIRSRLEDAREEYREGIYEANRRAEEMLQVKAAFLNNMNHEIRTPLTGILGYAEIILENGDLESREYARVIRRAGQRLMDTLSTILDLASLEAGEFDLRFTISLPLYLSSVHTAAAA